MFKQSPVKAHNKAQFQPLNAYPTYPTFAQNPNFVEPDYPTKCVAVLSSKTAQDSKSLPLTAQLSTKSKPI